jgi:hypothetical protein
VPEDTMGMAGDEEVTPEQLIAEKQQVRLYKGS